MLAIVHYANKYTTVIMSSLVQPDCDPSVCLNPYHFLTSRFVDTLDLRRLVVLKPPPPPPRPTLHVPLEANGSFNMICMRIVQTGTKYTQCSVMWCHPVRRMCGVDWRMSRPRTKNTQITEYCDCRKKSTWNIKPILELHFLISPQNLSCGLVP